MNDEWASENLQTIRILMERSAVYRRALGPVMTVTGVIGMGAALAGWKANITAPGTFVLYWLGVAVVAVIAGMVLIRRQALQQSETFWSPPMRRVSQAMFPALFAGLCIGLLAVVRGGSSEASPDYTFNVGIPIAWAILYGCAVHAAGFFMPRGIRLFGWAVILLGCGGIVLGQPQTNSGMADTGYTIMGIVFGLLHTVYGLYLFATEKRSRVE